MNSEDIRGNECLALAKAYVELSNAHKPALISSLLTDSIQYQSTGVGDFSGKVNVINMMTGFFNQFLDVSWQVESYRIIENQTVEFNFIMNVTNKDSLEKIQRNGLETIIFDQNGLITTIRVEAS